MWTDASNGNSTLISHVGGRETTNGAFICFLPESELAGNWNCELRPGIKPKYYNTGCRQTNFCLNNTCLSVLYGSTGVMI